MAILPQGDAERIVRPACRIMFRLFDQLRAHNPDFKWLSMGMSHDYQIALEEGATEIRIGSIFFQ
jgi:hypothetical protein